MMINLRHTYFFQFLDGGNFFSLNPDLGGHSNFKSSLEKATSVRGPIENLFHGAYFILFIEFNLFCLVRFVLWLWLS